MSLLRTFLAVVVAALLAAAPVGAVGFQYGSAPDGDNPALELAIWYPSDAPVTSQPVGLFHQDVAPNGAVKGDGLPLIVISHGTGGAASVHYDTALALAEAGFVVVALSHTGDNYKDHSIAFTARNFADRPRHVSRVIDFMLGAWNGHGHLDGARIGFFGHSAGGATGLIAIGGNPDFYLALLFCQDHPEDWGCQQRQKFIESLPEKPVETAYPEWPHEPRIKAAAIAAPAVGYTFTKVGLENVTAHVQLWRAENDAIAPNKWNGEIVKDALPQPPDDRLVPNAGHFSFLAPCNLALAAVAPEVCKDPPAFDRSAFHRDFNRAIIAFFKAQLPPP